MLHDAVKPRMSVCKFCTTVIQKGHSLAFLNSNCSCRHGAEYIITSFITLFITKQTYQTFKQKGVPVAQTDQYWNLSRNVLKITNYYGSSLCYVLIEDSWWITKNIDSEAMAIVSEPSE